MAYVKVENGIVTHKRPNHQKGYVEAPDDVVVGFVQNDDGTFSPPTPTVEQRKRDLREQAENEYQASLERGFNYDGGQWPATGPKRARVAEYVAQINAGKGLPQNKSSLRFWDMSGISHNLSETGIIELGANGSDLVDQADDRLEQLYGKIDAATSQSELDSIDPTARWPN